MADNVTIDPGTTPSVGVATDDVGGQHYQKVKLFDPTADSSTGIGIAANPMHVQGTISEPTASSATLANVAGSASSVTLQASNASRKGLIVFNDSTAALYIKFGATASATSFTFKVYPNGTFQMDTPVYTGVVDGIWDSATGNARVTEL